MNWETILNNPIEGIYKKTPNSIKKRPFTREDKEKILKKNPKKAILLFLYFFPKLSGIS